MSTKLTSYVWDGCASSGMKLSSVAIMARLADFSSDEGVCWPSIATIARQIGAGESTVRTAISALEKEGWLTRKSRRQGNRNASNVYTLNVQKLRAAAFAHLPDSDTSNPDASKSDASKSDASESDPSKFEASEFSKKGGFDPSESGGDPSVNTTTDPSDIKPPCQVAGQPDDEVVEEPDPEVLITDQAILVLNHLNAVAGSKFQKSKTSLENIRARLREGHTVEDMILMVDYKHVHWEGTTQYDYMQPTTLFRPTKFEGYLHSAVRWNAKGRPARETWDSHRKPKNDSAFKATHGQVDYSLPDNAGFRT